MSNIDLVNQALKSIGMQLGTSLALDARGTAVLSYGDGLSCTLALADGGDNIVLLAPVASVHDDERRSLFEAALRFNLTSPPDTSVGYEANRRELVLSGQIAAADVTMDRLAESLSAFLRAALSVRDKLQDAARRAASAA